MCGYKCIDMAFPPVISDIARYNGAISNREISENSMSTIKDVARLANVSVATVSRVMNNSPKASAASREVVQKAMAELGYTPNANARALVSQTCDTMGVVVGDVADPVFGALVKAMGLKDIDWEAAIRETVKPKTVDVNIAAYKAGYAI